MKRSTKSKRVTWASGLNLCQVRQFFAEDCPSKVGQDHQGPPGFESIQYTTPKNDASSRIPRIQWKCPPKVVTSPEWRVAAGEERREAESQKLRQTRVLESLYPHRASIPPSPSVSPNVNQESYNDSLTPLVPLTPIEEAQDPISSGTSNTPTIQPPTSNKPKLADFPDKSADIIGAALSAVDTLKKSTDLSTIDTELLLKILSDPKSIQKLTTTIIPKSKILTSPIPSKPAPVDLSKNEVKPSISRISPRVETFGSVSLPKPEMLHKPDWVQSAVVARLKNEFQPPLPRIPSPLKTFTSVYLPRPVNLGTVPHKPDQVQSVSTIGSWPVMPPGMMPVRPEQSSGLKHNLVTVKPKFITDMSYIKNLIEEHGTEKKGPLSSNRNNQIKNLEFGHNVKSEVNKRKFQKPCMYFRGPKGCRNGSNCLFQHDMSDQYRSSGHLDVPIAKRMKFSGEITVCR